MQFQRRPYQEETAAAWYKAFQDPELRPIVAIPTGGGKTMIMSMLVATILTYKPSATILILSHTQEILKQDYEALDNTLVRSWGVIQDYEIGLYSAGLNSKDLQKITVAGIHSCYKKPHFKGFDYYIVDECHTVNHKSDGMYRTLLEGVEGRIGGMSATVFRTGYGYIHEGYEDDREDTNLFNYLAYDITRGEAFLDLVDAGYLAELTTQKTDFKYDTSNLKRVAGDFNQKDMSDQFDIKAITMEASKELIKLAANRKKWLVFAIDTAHANNIATALRHLDKDLKVDVLHTKINGNRAEILDNFKHGDTRVLVSVGMITTGFDAPNVDLIAMLRPTESAALHVQMLGRGLRPCQGKKDCKVLDFAGNVERLGPINYVTLPQKPRPPKEEIDTSEIEDIGKTCPECEEWATTMQRVCKECGYRWPVKKTHLKANASGAQAMKTRFSVGWYDVYQVDYDLVDYKGFQTLKVIYLTKCGNRIVEYVHLSQDPWTSEKVLADHWVTSRGYCGELNATEVYFNHDQLLKPIKIKVDSTRKSDRVVDAKLEIKFKNVKQETNV